MDLVGRKLPLGNGEVVRAYIGEMRETAEMCRQSNHPVLTQVAGSLAMPLAHLKRQPTGCWTAQNPARWIRLPVPPLFAPVWSGGGRALSCQGCACRNSGEALDPAFVNRKLSSIRFFGANMLTACGGLAASVMAGNDVVDDIGLEALAG